MINKYIDLRQQDNFIYNEIFVQNTYHAMEEEIRDKVIIDVGANIGLFVLFASDFKPKLTVAIEADKTNFNQMLNNLKKFNIANVVTIYKAIQSVSNKIMYIEDKGGLAKTVETPTDNSVTTETLANIINQYCKPNDKLVLKIDCEGAEYDILLNISMEVVRKFDYIYAEIHKNPNKDVLINKFSEWGFKNTYQNTPDPNGSEVYKFENDKSKIY